MSENIGRSLGTGYFLIRAQLTDREIDYLERTRQFVDEEVREVFSVARDALGGNGILLDNHVMRHVVDVEAVYPYEGTESMQTPIVGRDTRVSAFV